MASVVKRGNGYRITVSCGYDATEKKLRATETWNPEPKMTEKQIKKALERESVLFEERVRKGQYTTSDIKFADFAENWFKDYAERQLSKSTVSGYRDYIKIINQELGHIKLSNLKPKNLIEFYNKLEENGSRRDLKYRAKVDLSKLLKISKLSRHQIADMTAISHAAVERAVQGKNVSLKTVESVCKVLNKKIKDTFNIVQSETLSGNTVLHYHHLISIILSTAVNWQIIESNPADRVKPPKIEQKDMAYLDNEQCRKLIQYLEKAPMQYRVMVMLLLYSGMRRGELCGLEWKDIDFDKKIIDIRRSSQYLPKIGVFTKEPKNKSSIRAFKLPDSVFDMLKAYKSFQTAERLKLANLWVGSDRLFTNWNGKPLNPDVLTRWFHDFIKKTDLPDIHIHSLRHTNATLLISEGVNITLVADMLGHSKPTTTLNIYSHAIKSAQAEASKQLVDILNNHDIKVC